jgi:hypothetical protein
MAVALEDAKRHLHITDPARDGEVTYTLTHALATVTDYLGTPAVPPSADLFDRGTLITLAHYWEHRGDDGAPDDHAAALWRELDLLFKRTRDPALA